MSITVERRGRCGTTWPICAKGERLDKAVKYVTFDPNIFVYFIILKIYVKYVEIRDKSGAVNINT